MIQNVRQEHSQKKGKGQVMSNQHEVDQATEKNMKGKTRPEDQDDNDNSKAWY